MADCSQLRNVGLQKKNGNTGPYGNPGLRDWKERLDLRSGVFALCHRDNCSDTSGMGAGLQEPDPKVKGTKAGVLNCHGANGQPALCVW